MGGDPNHGVVFTPKWTNRACAICLAAPKSGAQVSSGPF